MGCSHFPFSHGNVYLFSLCVASQSKIKNTPNRIHVSIFVWRRPDLLSWINLAQAVGHPALGNAFQ